MISVIIATFGDPSWRALALERAIPSAKAQADDVVAAWSAVGPVEDIRNIEGKKARGDWLCFLDADDELAPGFIDAMNDMIEWDMERQGGICRTVDDPYPLFAPAVTFVRERSRSAPAIPGARHSMPPLNHAVVGTVVNRAVFVRAGGFDPDFWPWSDYELWLRCARLGCELVEVPEAVYLVHVNPESDNQTLGKRERIELGRRIHAEHKAAGGRWPIKGGEAHRGARG